jgi:WhiB family redox-sensing transcriptional regulator
MSEPIGVNICAAEPWMADGLCAQVDPDCWFPEKGGSTAEAKRICLGCDIREQCLQYALDHDERFGVWGGYSERDRRKLARGQTVPLLRVRSKPLRTCTECGNDFQGSSAAKYCGERCRSLGACRRSNEANRRRRGPLRRSA